MPALILDGKTLAAQTEADLLQRVEHLKAQSAGKTPFWRPFWWAMTPPRPPM